MADMTVREMWNMQLQFSEMVCQKLHGKSMHELTDKERISEAKEYAFSLLVEIGETFGTLPWKRHRSDQPVVNREKMISELIDVQKYLLEVMQFLNLSVEEFCVAFEGKSVTVMARWEAEKARLV